MDKSELELDTRRKIFEVIEEFPGLHMRAIQRKTDLDLNLVKYHIGKLKQNGLISEMKEKGYKRYYPEGPTKKKVDYKDKKILSILRKEKPFAIIIYMLNKGGKSSHKDISEDLDIPASTLSYHLKKLEEKDILEKKNRKYIVKNEKHISWLLMEYEPPKDIIDDYIDAWEDFSL